jgi:outer membrane receptor for ferrienterochelin and colicins
MFLLEHESINNIIYIKNKMKKLLFALFCISVSLCYAEEPVNVKIRKSDANIVGDVKDKSTQEHIPYATVSIQGTTIGTVTDNTGHYFLKNLPVGEFKITVNCLGYKPITKKVTTVKGKTLIINFEIEEDNVALEGVVVSANRSETKRRLAPTLVNVVSLKTFEHTSSCNLSQGLSFQPGVRVENDCQNCGFSQVRINGLEGRYTQILIDSRAIVSSLSGVYGLEHIPTNMIDRVEVMRGGGSALFGSSAIAGTINVITKEPLRNSGSISHTTSNINGSGAFEHNTALNLSLVTDDHKAGAYIYAQNRYRSAYDDNGDGYSELPSINMQTLGTRGYFKTSDYSKLSFEYHHIEEFRRGGNDQDLPPEHAVNPLYNSVKEDGIVEQIEHSINSGGLTFDYFAPNQKNQLSVYFSAQHIGRKSYYNGYGKTQNTTLVTGAKYVHNFDKLWFMPADLTIGAEYNFDDLKDRSLEPAKEIQENLPPIHQICRISSAYAQNEWKTEKWSILLGARVDKHNKIDHAIFSPRANLRYNLTPYVNFRLSYAEGFRAPQAFDEDLHIGNVGTDIKVIKLSKDLKEEKSRSINASIDMYKRWGDFQANLLVEGFYTRLSDAFTTRVIDEKDLGNEYSFYVEERINGSGAKVYGATVEGNIAYKKIFQLQAGVTLQKSLYDDPEEWSGDSGSKAGKARYSDKILRTPNTYGYFTATYTPIKPLSIALSGTYTGHMYVPHLWSEVLGSDASGKPIKDDELVKTPTFFEMNCKVAYDFDLSHSLCLELNAGIKNIFNAYQDDFDKGGTRDSGYIYGPGSPRTYFIGAKISY